MQIPLDYYRILGLPIQTSAEQLQQAYRDRTIQLPRREYSPAAIVARKQLIEQAYAVLSQPEKRAVYDANYFAYTYDHDDHRAATITHTPSIDIREELFVGALLILQELGEYELVLNLGPAYLKANSTTQDGQKSELDVRSDIVGAIALASLELGREQWQQGQYENAATALENGQQLLLQEKLFPNIRNEIQADLDKLRPYRILELLAQPGDQPTRRRWGLKLLQDVLEQRGGIDGTGDDGSGLSLDDFLRFIQQLRSYLTTAEQQSLFAAESQRPSAVATYLTVYALLARGFAQRQPVLIREAKLLLMRLGKRQDVNLEKAVCSLLLGQTAEASRALELSQEEEPLAYIRENSQDSPDLLPGLCLYSERWLQTEVFPQFQDLAQQRASLKDYFADKQVQAYLEALPTQTEATNEWAAVAPSTPKTATARQSESQRVSAASSVALAPAAERATTTTNHNHTALHNASTLTQAPAPPQQLRRRTRNRFQDVGVDHGTALVKRHSSLAPIKTTLRNKKTRLILLALAGCLGIVVLGFLINQIAAWLRNSAPASLQGEQPLVELNQPPLPIPSPGSQLLAQESINQEVAEQVIQTWLSTKAAAFGSDHAVNKLAEILAEPALSQWQQRVKQDQKINRHRQFKHSLKVNSVQTATPNQAQVEATVNEVAQVYTNGQLNKNASYNDNLRVRYDLIRQDGQWRIRQMTVLK